MADNEIRIVTNNKKYQVWLYRLTGFFSLFTAFYFDLGLINVRVNDIFYYMLCLFSFFLCIKKLRIGQPIGYLPIVLTVIVIVFYTFNLLGVIGLNEVFTRGAIKYFINRIPWLLIYVFILMALGKNFCKEFLNGFIIGALFCSVLMTIELTVFLKSGQSINYSFLSHFGVSTEPYKGISNQGLLRPSGVTMDCNYSASYAVLAALILDETQLFKKKLIYSITKLFLILSALIVQSRTAIFGLIGIFLLSVLFRILNKKFKVIVSKQMIVLIACSITALLYLYYNIPEIFDRSFQRVALADSSSGTRVLYFEKYKDEMLKNKNGFLRILFGNGTGSAGYILADVGYGKEAYWAPESNYLTFIIEQGIVFLFIFILIVFLSFVKLFELKSNIHIVFIYLLTVGATYNFLGDRVYWLLLLIFMSIPRISEDKAIFA